MIHFPETETITKPQYLAHTEPQEISIEKLHQDFHLSSKYLLKSGIYKSEDFEYYVENYPNSIITHQELSKIVDFWKLDICHPSEFIGEIPYKNQLEIVDFLEHLQESEKGKESEILVVATPDLVYKKHQEFEKLEKLKIGLQFKRIELILKEDPIILYPISFTQQGQSILAYLIITLWGNEAKILSEGGSNV